MLIDLLTVWLLGLLISLIRKRRKNQIRNTCIHSSTCLKIKIKSVLVYLCENLTAQRPVTKWARVRRRRRIRNTKQGSLIIIIIIIIITTTLKVKDIIKKGARGSVVGWGTTQQAGRSRVRIPMRWIFSIVLLLPPALCLRGQLSL
jgi:hypothetical protein